MLFTLKKVGKEERDKGYGSQDLWVGVLKGKVLRA